MESQLAVKITRRQYRPPIDQIQSKYNLNVRIIDCWHRSKLHTAARRRIRKRTSRVRHQRRNFSDGTHKTLSEKELVSVAAAGNGAKDQILHPANVSEAPKRN